MVYELNGHVVYSQVYMATSYSQQSIYASPSGVAVVEEPIVDRSEQVATTQRCEQNHIGPRSKVIRSKVSLKLGRSDMTRSSAGRTGLPARYSPRQVKRLYVDIVYESSRVDMKIQIIQEECQSQHQLARSYGTTPAGSTYPCQHHILTTPFRRRLK